MTMTFRDACTFLCLHKCLHVFSDSRGKFVLMSILSEEDEYPLDPITAMSLNEAIRVVSDRFSELDFHIFYGANMY